MQNNNSNARDSVLLLEIVAAALTIVLLGIGFCAAYRFFFRAAYPMDYSQAVLEYSQENRLPPSLVYAVIRTESGFHPTAQSGAPARGLMQITQETFEWAQMRLEEAEELSYDDLFDPVLNIRYGTAILRMHLDEFGTVENALCAYHAGRGSVLGWLEDPAVAPDGRNVQNIPIRETKHYVSKVLEAKGLYETLYDL